MALTRIGGMTFNNIHITNLDFDLNTYKLISADIPLTPTMTYREFSAPKRHGSKKYDNRYENKIITVTIGVTGTAIERQDKITSLLEQWIGLESKLMFDNRPGLFYKAKFFDAVETEDTGTFTEFTIVFDASYCMYRLYSGLSGYTVDQLTMPVDDMFMLFDATQDNTLVTTGITREIGNFGNYVAQPVFVLIGTATLFLLTIGEYAFSFTNLNGTAYIDTENMIVYEIVNNKKVSLMQQFSGKFPTIPPGAHDAIIGGTDLNLTVFIDFRDTFIV